MAERKNRLRLVLLLTVVALIYFANHKVKADEMKTIYRPRLNDTEFLVPGKSGFLRSYRRVSSEPLIDFISLIEEDKAQCLISGIKWKYNLQNCIKFSDSLKFYLLFWSNITYNAIQIKVFYFIIK